MEHPTRASAGGRPPRLTFDGIVAATLALIDEEGLQGVSMRRLATRLNVQAASLYPYVRSKEALIDAVADSVMSGIDTSAFERLGWREAVREWSTSYYETLVAHPNLVPHLGVAFGRLPSVHRVAADVYSGLRRAGWSAGRATRIAGAIRYAVYGAALGSFAGGFSDEAERQPHLENIGKLRERADTLNREVLALLIDRFLLGLDDIAPAPPASTTPPDPEITRP